MISETMGTAQTAFRQKRRRNLPGGPYSCEIKLTKTERKGEKQMTGRAESIYRCLDDLPELCEIPCMRLGVRYIFSREHLKLWLERSMRREAG